MSKIKYTSAFFAAFLVIAIFAGVVPSAVGTNGGSDLFEDAQSLVDIYNQNIENIPVITSFIGEERIRCEISLNNGTEELIIGITTDEDAKITSFEKGEITDPTINASTNENTVRTIMNSDDPVSAFQDALDSGAIIFEGVGLGDKIKVGVMKVVLKIAGFFM
ncbi:MAG: hypothetical protein WA977_06020 [Halobacteriota archaeon]